MQTIIDLQNIKFSYPKNSEPILEDISLNLKEEEIVFLLGANGCGKSTLFKLLIRDLEPSSGQLFMRKNIAIVYISQNIQQNLFLDLTIQENITLMNIYFSHEKKAKAYLETYNRNLPLYFNQPVKMLSGGEKQALALSIHLYAKPDVLLLDEHTSALDPEAEKVLMELTYQKIIQQRITTLICTHKVSLADKYSHRIIGLNKGKLVLEVMNTKKGLSTKELSMIYGS